MIDRLYEASPIWLQQAAVAAYGAWWYRRRFGPGFQRAVAELRARDGWSAERRAAAEEAQLGRLLAAAARAPHYAGRIRRDLPPREALACLPILDKQTLRTRPHDLLTRRPPPGTLRFHTSGTTGTPTEILFTRDFHQLVQAFFEVRSRAWAGVTHRDRRAMFGMRKVCAYDQQHPPFWRRSPVENLTYFSIQHLGPRFLPAYAAELRRLLPTVVMGYPSCLRAVAEHGPYPPARAVITTSEPVSPETRRVLEEAWGCRVFDTYCSVEACLLATGCEHGRLHVSPDFGLLEIVDGRAVATGLHNFLQPLLRYDLGDRVAWAEEQGCPCGRALPILEAVEGRAEDVCTTVDGRRVHAFDAVFAGLPAIREAQVIQEAPAHFVVKLVTDGPIDTAPIRARMRAHVGEVRTDVQIVDHIARAGKFRAVIFPSLMDELARIRAENARREREIAPDFYALDRPANLFLRHGQERALLDGLRWARLLPLGERRVVEIGCAAGGWLAALEAFGARRANLAGIDLEPARIEQARARLPGADLALGDAARLPWPDESFDVALQLTVFSSILDASMRRAVAAEMLRVLRPGGAVVWYDFVYDNPRNRHVKGIGRAELRALFPACAARFRRVTLAPPLARRLVPLSWALGRALESLRILNTHDLAVFIR